MATIRNKISRDLHDDLGSGLSGIRLMAESALRQNVDREKGNILWGRIAHTASYLGNQISEIIWASSTARDNAECLLLYIQEYAVNYLESAGIACHCLLPEQISNKAMDGETRRNIFLSVKEALHNVVKHAVATKVFVHLHCDNNLLTIGIEDDGKGVNGGVASGQGNGLENMRQRIENQVGGRFYLESKPGKTCITFTIPI